MSTTQLFTSESVTSGHPDKVCDQISDAVLDAALKLNPDARVAVETMATTNRVVIAGELSGAAGIDYARIVREVVAEIGYLYPGSGFNAKELNVEVLVGEQSADIAQSVSRSQEAREEHSADMLSLQGAGDQGLMFGFACDETPELMPLPIALAHRLARRLEAVRREELNYLRPDGKTQVCVEYAGNQPVAIDTVLISTQHDEEISLLQLREEVAQRVIEPVLTEFKDLASTQLRTLINPSGRFVIGGPAGDTGLTGRKIIVDTYGGVARHGGGAFSGKDPSKVDRSASYAMRWVAKNVVAAGLASRCELQVSYAIGRAEPVSVWVNTFGTGVVRDAELREVITECVDLRPAAITEALQLRHTEYLPTATYGHFGRSEFPWESTELAAKLMEVCGRR